jgi:hypothetical protein
MRALIIVFLLICIGAWTTSAFSPRSYDRVRLQDVPSLTFRSGFTVSVSTTGGCYQRLYGRYSSRESISSCIHQLQYVGGNGPPLRLPLSVTCHNTGLLDNGSISWKCSSEDLDSVVSIDAVSVECNGYDSETDPYVSVGSCRLRYKLRDPRTERLDRSHDLIRPENQLIAAAIIGTIFLLAAVIPTIIHIHIQRKHRRVEKGLFEYSPLSSDVN